MLVSNERQAKQEREESVSSLTLRIKGAIGLLYALDVERDTSRTSGFRPALTHKETGLHLFGEERLLVAAGIRIGALREIRVFGRNEPRYANELVEIDGNNIPLNQAWAISRMLILDYGVPADAVTWFPSNEGSLENSRAMAKMVATNPSCTFVGITSGYHVFRAAKFFRMISREFCPEFCAAEAFWLAEGKLQSQEEMVRRKEVLTRSFGGGEYARRCVSEINSDAEFLFENAYIPSYRKTDPPSMS